MRGKAIVSSFMVLALAAGTAPAAQAQQDDTGQDERKAAPRTMNELWGGRDSAKASAGDARTAWFER